jgi:hypothetical protein
VGVQRPTRTNDVYIEVGMSVTNIEAELSESLAKEFQKTIDFDVMCDVLSRFGWAVIEVDYGPEQQWIDVMAWVDHNCSGDYQEHNGKWLFKNEQDAILFKLKWL